MGYPGPCGAPGAIQYTYVDTAAVPAHLAKLGFTERLVLLPHTYYLNDYAASHAELLRSRVPPSADSLTPHCVLLCSLNQLPKLDPSLYSAWLNALSRAAARAPCTRLWLLRFPAAGEAHLRREAHAHASPPPRAALIGLPTVRHVAHLRRAQHCDLMLDSALCNAHTSGTDALWAGTPMLTMPGETQTARVALSLLKAVAQPELAVASLRAFEDAATALTADLTPTTALTADLTPTTALTADLTPITALTADLTPITALTADVDGAGAPRVWPRG
jgi:protein O-GlcNAc transferase